MMTTLTDRYVWAVVRAVPQDQRADIERELRASIADDVEARIADGADAVTAEREALLALGDPDRLAASYAQRPNMLIGPRYYFDYLRLLKVLYAIVLPIAVAAIILARTIAGDGIGEVIGSSVATAIAIAVHLGFWTTLVFAILERTSQPRKGPFVEWRLDALPELPDTRSRTGLGEAIASVVFLLFFAGALVWQQVSSVFVDAAGDPIPLLQPELWSFWIPYVYVLIGLELAFAIVLYALRRWTWPMAAINVVLNVAFVAPAAWLVLNDRVFNPEFLSRLGWPDQIGASILAPVMALVFVLGGIGDSADGIVKARRATRQ